MAFFCESCFVDCTIYYYTKFMCAKVPALKHHAKVIHFRFQQNTNMTWVKLPRLILSDVMMMVGLESLESLHRCRQVCKTWNEMILRDIWENPSKKRIMKERIERSWGRKMLPSDEEIAQAKWLGDDCLLLIFITNIILLCF